MTMPIRSFMSATALALALLVATPAFALVVPPTTTTTTTTTPPGQAGAGGATALGCNPTTAAAAQAAATAVAAGMRAQLDTRISQPPSTAQMTCFNQAASVSGTQGGNIFSGDFSGDLQPIVGTALNSLYSNFDSAVASFFGGVTSGQSVGDAAGNAISGLLGGLFGSGASSITSSAQYECDGIERMWEGMSTRGVTPGIIPSFAQLLNGTPPPGADEKFLKAWNAAKDAGVFANAKSAKEALPKPVQHTFDPNGGLCDNYNRMTDGRGCR